MSRDECAAATTASPKFTVKRLESGYYHLRGVGLCNWAQPARWPVPDEAELEESFFPEAGREFRTDVMLENLRLLEAAGYCDEEEA
jgi:hypothetical protein